MQSKFAPNKSVFLSHGGAGWRPLGKKELEEHQSYFWKFNLAFLERCVFEELEYQSLLPGRILHHRRNDKAHLIFLEFLQITIGSGFLSLCTTCEKKPFLGMPPCPSPPYLQPERDLLSMKGSPDRMWMKRNDTWAGVLGCASRWEEWRPNQLCSLHQLWWARHRVQNEWSLCQEPSSQDFAMALRLQRPTEIT